MQKENITLSTETSSFFWFGKKKEQEKPSLMLRWLLDFGKKLRDFLWNSLADSVSSSFLFAFLPVQIRRLRKGI